MDGSAIKELVDLAVAASGGVAIGGDEAALALPGDLVIHDIERYSAAPARYRGVFTTNTIGSFVAYVKSHYNVAASALYIHTDSMSAQAILDAGTPSNPLHGESRALIKSEPTLEFQAVQNSVSSWKPQEAAIEWLEDWFPNLSAGSDKSISSVIHALRNIRVTTDSAKESVVSEFSASKSALEKIEAKSSAGEIPSTLFFTCAPYSFSDKQKVFPLRVKIKTTKDGVMIAFSCTVLAQILEEIREEFKDSLSIALKDAEVSIPIYIGTFKHGKP